LVTDKVTKDIIHKGKEYGMILYAIDELSIEFKLPAALMMGFTGFKKEIMKQAVINLKSNLKYISGLFILSLLKQVRQI